MSGALPRLRRVKALQHGLTLLGAITAVGLLLLFLQVVSGAVQQGERLHAAAARQGEASLRCRSQPDARRREICRARLDAGSPQVVLLQEGDLVQAATP